jgi:flagellar hook-associated protein 1 FlgK
MSDLFAALNAASSALRAFQSALDVTQNNVSNSQTPGYVKQAPSLDALSFDLRNGLSGGVESGSPQSSRNEYAEAAVQQQVSLLGSSSQLATSLDPIEQVFNVTGTGGVANALDALFQSFSAWSATPGDVSAQQAVLGAASQVAAAFGQSAAQLDKIRTSVNSDLQTTLASINQIAGDIQQYNIAKQRSATPDAGLDAQLHASLEQLAQYADVQTLTNADGTVTVLLGGQVPLVAEDQVHNLSLQYVNPANAANPAAEPDASLVDDNGVDVTAKITGGQLGALLSVKNQVLPHLSGGPSDAGDINVLAKQVADAVNGVLASAGGKPLFTYDQTSAVDSAGTLAVSSGFAPPDLVAADPGPPPVSNGIALRLSALAGNANPALQGMTFDQFYGSSASWIGDQLSQAQTASTAQTQTVSQARALRQQLSGVSLDEEATRLMTLQRSYQAASKMVTVIDSLSQDIMNMLQ